MLSSFQFIVYVQILIISHFLIDKVRNIQSFYYFGRRRRKWNCQFNLCFWFIKLIRYIFQYSKKKSSWGKYWKRCCKLHWCCKCKFKILFIKYSIYNKINNTNLYFDKEFKLIGSLYGSFHSSLSNW